MLPKAATLSLILIVAAAPGGGSAAAQTSAAATACPFPAPPVKTALAAPLDGSTGAPTRLRLIVVQADVPVGNNPSIPNLDEQRVVLDDGSGYPAEGGILSLVGGDQLPEPHAPLIELPGPLAAAGTMRYVGTWVPPLKPQTRYEVRIVLPYQGNCAYADVGSFTTGTG
jgi:hypothetical protein